MKNIINKNNNIGQYYIEIIVWPLGAEMEPIYYET